MQFQGHETHYGIDCVCMRSRRANSERAGSLDPSARHLAGRRGDKSNDHTGRGIDHGRPNQLIGNQVIQFQLISGKCRKSSQKPDHKGESQVFAHSAAAGQYYGQQPDKETAGDIITKVESGKRPTAAGIGSKPTR